MTLHRPERGRRSRRPAASRALSWLVGTAIASAAAAASPGVLAAPTNLAYVSSEKDDAVTLIDLKTQAVTGTIATCKRPRHMQIMPGGGRLLVVCSNSDRADIIDLGTRKSVDRIPLGEDPEVLDLSPDGKVIYVSNEDDAKMTMLDVTTKKPIRSVKTGPEPEGVKVSPDGKVVYVASEVANMVHVIETDSGRVVKNIGVGNRPRRFAITPDGGELWVTNELAGSVTVIDRAGHAVKDEIKFEVKGMRSTDITPVGLVIARDGKTAWVGLGKANHVAAVDIATRKVRSLVLVGKRAWGLALTGDESQLYVANGLSDDLTIVDTGSAKALKSVKVGRVPHTVVIDDR